MLKFSDDKLKEVQRIIISLIRKETEKCYASCVASGATGIWWLAECRNMDYVASLLKLEPIEVYEVATFYSMYNLKPVGKYMFEVCQTGPCMINGVMISLNTSDEKLGHQTG